MLYKRKDIANKSIVDTHQYAREIATEETIVHTSVGDITVQSGDYIITDQSNNEKWVCKAIYFDLNFEAV